MDLGQSVKIGMVETFLGDTPLKLVIYMIPSPLQVLKTNNKAAILSNLQITFVNLREASYFRQGSSKLVFLISLSNEKY